MSKNIAKTFRLPIEVVQAIQIGAKENQVSQTQYLIRIVSESKLVRLSKSFNTDAKRMELDRDYMRQQRDLAEADLL